MQNKKWLLAFVCFLLAATMLLPSCGGGGKKGANTTPETQPQAAAGDPLKEMLPDKQYDSDFHIWNYFGEEAFCAREEDGDPIRTVEVQRTLYIEERFGVTLSSNKSGSYEQLKASQMSGGGEFDLIYPHPTSGIVDLMTSGSCANLLDLEYLHFSESWWNQSQVENYTANGKLYLCVNDMSIAGQSLLGLVYNRDRYKNYEFEDDLHDVAMAKNFTLEYLGNLLKACQSSIEGGDASTAEYGLLFQTDSSRRWMWALGERILTKNNDGEFVVALTAAPLTNMCKKLYTLLYETGDVLVEKTGGNAVFPTSNLWTTFSSGRALMTTFNIGSLHHMLRDLDFDYGFLPLPKLDDLQPDYLVVEASSLVAVPARPKNLEMSGVILETFAIYSYQKLRPAFFDVILMGRLSENPDDYEMLEFLHTSKFYDFGFTLDTNEDALGIINAVVVDKKAPDSAAIYLRSKTNALNALATLANTIE